MQIIGLTDDGFIFKASKLEIKELTNYYYYDGPKLEIGTIFDVHDMYNQVKGLLSNQQRINDINKELEKIIEFTKKISPIIAPKYKEEHEK